MRFLSALVLSLIFFGCSSPRVSQTTLHRAGFTQVEILGPGLFGCEKSNFKSNFNNTRFQAQGPKGDLVRGNVCCDVMEDCTVSF